jgi:predicted ester cyclase
MDLRQHYTDYIAALNERRFDDLRLFVADEIVYNEKRWTAADYRALLEDDVRRIPDLHYDVRQLVVEGDAVASRIHFDCTPSRSFHGLTTAGRRISFDEHVFYRFVDGRIVQVWSLLDLDAVRSQL